LVATRLGREGGVGVAADKVSMSLGVMWGGICEFNPSATPLIGGARIAWLAIRAAMPSEAIAAA